LIWTMKNNVLNERAVDTFVIISETLEKWQSPGSEEGKAVLMEHYGWGAELKAQNKLILAGPTDYELISTNTINPVGHTTGIIILKAVSREEAVRWAEADPFHVHGYRKNVVCSLKVTMTEGRLSEALQKMNGNE